jgi:hypothetical protein
MSEEESSAVAISATAVMMRSSMQGVTAVKQINSKKNGVGACQHSHTYRLIAHFSRYTLIIDCIILHRSDVGMYYYYFH